MEKEKEPFEVEFTSASRIFFFEIVEYLFDHYSLEKAETLSDELLEKALSLNINHDRGSLEPNLSERPQKYRYLLFERTKRKQVKIIYYVDEKANKVYVTDFFPTESDQNKISKRS